MSSIVTYAVWATTVCCFIAGFGFVVQDGKPYTGAVFTLYGLSNILIWLGSK